MIAWYRKHEQEVTILLFLFMLLGFLIIIGISEVRKKPALQKWWDSGFINDDGSKINHLNTFH